MNYGYNNDLVGKNRPWGKYGDLDSLRKSVYHRYYDMVKRCVNSGDRSYKTYGAVGIENHFKSLSEYYNTLKKDPLWTQFKSNPELYDIDKDIKKGHGAPYAPDTIMIVSHSINISEALKRTKSVAVEFDGVSYSSCVEASEATGFSLTNLSYHLHSIHGCTPCWVSRKDGKSHTIKYI